MFSVWSVRRIFHLLKMCDVSQRARTPSPARIMYMLILLYTGCSAKRVRNCIWQSDSYIGPVFRGQETFLFEFLDP